MRETENVNKQTWIQFGFAKILEVLSPLIKSDELYLKIYFFIYMGKWIDFSNMKTFSEKVQWLKMHNTDPIFTVMADKYASKQFVEDKLGPGYTFPLLGVWDIFEEIDFDKLPDKFVLKTNHDSGGVWIIKDKSKADFASIEKEIKKRQKKNYYYLGREYPYKNIPRKIIAEKYMEEAENGGLKDYKFFCFDGKPTYIQVDIDRFTNHRRDYYDTDWELMDFGVLYHRSCQRMPPPPHLTEMIEIARTLSQGLRFLRVDLFNLNGKVYVGELTFHPGGGVEIITPKEWEYKLGALINTD